MDRPIKVAMRIIVSSILAIAVLSGAEANRSTESCTPGEIMTKDCNTCFCLDGSRYVCTTMACVNGLTCRPGESFNHYCNVCNCPSNGLAQTATCTKNVCVEGMFREDGTLNDPLLNESKLRDKRQASSSEATCEPGKSFKHYCNTCRCGVDGLVKSAACTKMECAEGVFNEDGTTNPVARFKRQADGADATCKPGESFSYFCNTCYCGPDGLRESAACTEMGCQEGAWNEDGSLKQPLTDPTPRDKRQTGDAGGTCVPGTSFKWYCNTCHCGADGLRKSAACTRIGCRGDVWNEDGSLKQPLTDPTPRDKRQADGAGATCVPGTSFKKDCNTCWCPDSGLRDSAVCTLIGCLSGTWNEDGSLKQPLTDPTPRDKRQTGDAGGTCVPGTSFKWYCNTCHCGADGLRKSAACTRIGCIGDVWNEDGSLKQPLTDPTPRDKRQADGAGATCVPGTSFKNDCNTCWCPDSGLRDSAACTLIGCLSGTWNEDGS